MKQIFLTCLACGLLLSGMVVTATADDVQPPPWRGLPRTTSQVWEFLTANTGNPDGLKPDGPATGGLPPLPSTELVVYPISDWIEVDPSGSGREGIWPLSGEIAVHLDNYPEPLEKTMWVQLTWQPQEGVGVPVLSDFDAYPTATQTPPEIVGEVDLGFGWTETTYRWTIIPNPEWESFVIGGTINVDELVIDTWCPEPSTYVLLGLGAIALGFYRWRRKRA